MSSAPTLCVVIIVSWSYYAYVVEFCINTIQDTKKRATYLVFYHVFLIMFLWTFFKTIFTDVAIVPSTYKPPSNLYQQVKAADTDELKNKFLVDFCLNRGLNVITTTSEGFIRFCKKCKQIKPDRAHHCSTCGTCILKMDHHCPWANNCISFLNHKFFMLFLFYDALYCIFYAATTSEILFNYYFHSMELNIHVLVGFSISVSMSILMVSFGLYHFCLILRNETTLESLHGTTFHYEKLTFDIGKYENFIEVFGDRWYLWFIPVWTTFGDGLYFPTRLIF